MKKKIVVMGALLLSLTGSVLFAATGSAKIMSTSTNTTASGTATLEDTPQGLKVSATVEQVTPGLHGFHIHEFGRCDDKGQAAGSHYNPTNSPHGYILKDGSKHAHAGDMGNIDVNADNKGRIEVVIPNLTLSSGKNNVAGRALILHDKPDDFGQPVGNAGGRIGCGTIVITGN